jgi:hypothetical protein
VRSSLPSLRQYECVEAELQPAGSSRGQSSGAYEPLQQAVSLAEEERLDAHDPAASREQAGEGSGLEHVLERLSPKVGATLVFAGHPPVRGRDEQPPAGSGR